MKLLGNPPAAPQDAQLYGTLPVSQRFPSYAPTGLLSNWRADVSAYNFNGSSMHKLRAALKKLSANAGSLNVVAMGDSTLVGYNGSTYTYDDAIPRQAGKTIAQLLNVPFSNGIEQAIKAQGAVGDTTVLTGGFSTYVSTYPHFLTGFGAGTATWTSTDPGTSVEFYYSDLSVNNFTYQIDGGSAVAVTTGATSTIKKLTVSGLSHKRHTITINGVASNYVFIFGWRCWVPGINQVQIHNLAIGGSRANGGAAGLNWSNTTTASGGGLGFTAPATLTASGVTPDLALFSIGNNDSFQSTAVSDIIQGIRNMRAYLPAGTPLLIVHPPRVPNTDTTAFDAFGAALFSLTDELNCLYFDWNDWDFQLTGYSGDGLAGADGVHPLRAEQYGVGRHIGNLIAEDNPTTMPVNILDISSTTTAIPNTWYRSDSTVAGAFTVTLPTAPPDGAVVIVDNVGNVNAVNYIRGGSDTIEGATTAFTVNPQEVAELTYQSANTRWIQRRSLAAPTAGTMMRRDANGRSQVATPAVAGDIANKGYVDGLASASSPLTIVIGASGAAYTPLAANTWYRIAGGGGTSTLPTAPTNGTFVKLENTATDGTFVNYQRGGTTDTIEGNTTLSIESGAYAELTYRSADTTWYLNRFHPSNVAGTNVRRDSGGRAQVSTPVNLPDATSKYYVDSLSGDAAATASTLVRRNAFGQTGFTDPTAAAHPVTKGYQDGKVLATRTTLFNTFTAATETVVLQAAIPANSPYFTSPGRPVKIRLFGYSNATPTLTFRVRAGAAGTTADTVIWTSTTTAAQAANQRASIDVEAMFTSAGIIIAEGDGTAGTVAVGTAVAAPGTASITTTSAWYLTITMTVSSSNGFGVRMGSIIVQ